MGNIVEKTDNNNCFADNTDVEVRCNSGVFEGRVLHKLSQKGYYAVVLSNGRKLEKHFSELTPVKLAPIEE